jgi:DNA-binding beta-propeller fold protein YncE
MIMRWTFIVALAAFHPVQAAAAEAPLGLAVIGAIHGPDGGWDYASVDGPARRLYIAHGDAVMSVDLDTGAVNPRLIGGERLHSVALLPGGRALVTNGGDNTATLFTEATGDIIASIPTGAGPDAAIFDPWSGLALVMDGRGGEITLIDPKAATAVGDIQVGGKLEFAAADGKGKAFVNIEDRDEIAVIDIAARKVAARYPLTGCESPTGLNIDPATGTFIAACANHIAVALDAKDGKIVATPPIGGRPDAVIFDPGRGLFFIPCGEGSLAVIAATGTPRIVDTIPTAIGARTGALDAKTGKLYLPTADFGAVPAGQERPAIIPGTFRILVVGRKSG